jgi:hypothetical protein
MGVAKEYFFPNGSKVTIMDDYVTKDPVEIQKILDQISEIYTRALGRPVVAFSTDNPPPWVNMADIKKESEVQSMGRKPEPLKTESFIRIDGVLHRFSDLPEDVKEACIKRMMERCSQVMSDYYAQHPECLENSRPKE